jgi:hypothetical protein
MSYLGRIFDGSLLNPGGVFKSYSIKKFRRGKMKKIAILLVLCFLGGTMFLSADDASVLPARVGRVYLTPTFAFANGGYDTDGAYKSYGDGEGTMRGFLLGAALEYGILDWISAAVQWTPGWMAASDVDTELGDSDVNINGVTDLFIGGKFQIVGEKAPVQTSMFRWSLATGIKVPFPGPDYEEQAKNAGKGNAVTAANQDRHVLGLGVRSYFDYVVNENFYLDLYGEFIGYPVKGKLSESGLTEYGIIQNLKGAQIEYSDEVDYGFDLTLELEPVYSLPLAQGVRFTAGLPLTYQFSPAKKYDINISVSELDEDSSHALNLKPSVAFFFTDFLLPTELKLNYSAPIAGNNKMATHSLTLQIKVYFRI